MRWLMRLAPVPIALALVTAACSKAPPASTPAQEAAAPQSEITSITVAIQASDPRLDAIIATFQEKHAEYRVDKVAIAAGQDLSARIKAGEIDVVPTEYTLGLLTSQSLLSELTSFVQKSTLDLVPYGQLLETGKVSGKLFALPVFASPNVLAYNRRLMQEAGVTLPAGRWSWEQFADTARRLTRGNGDEKVWGLDPFTVSAPDLVHLRAKALAQDSQYPDAAAFRESLQFFAGMTRHDLSMAPGIPFAYQGAEPPPTYWDKGKAAFSFISLPLLQYGRQPDAALAPLPADPGTKPALIVNVSPYGMAANTAHADAAWAFLSFLAGPEGAALLAGQGYLPAYSVEAARRAWAENPANGGSDVLFDAAWYLKPIALSNPSPLYTMYKTSSQVLSGAASVDDAVTAYEGALLR